MRQPLICVAPARVCHRPERRRLGANREAQGTVTRMDGFATDSESVVAGRQGRPTGGPSTSLNTTIRRHSRTVIVLCGLVILGCSGSDDRTTDRTVTFSDGAQHCAKEPMKLDQWRKYASQIAFSVQVIEKHREYQIWRLIDNERNPSGVMKLLNLKGDIRWEYVNGPCAT